MDRCPYTKSNRENNSRGYPLKKKFFIFFLLLCSYAFSKDLIFETHKTNKGFNSKELYHYLDSIGKRGNWMHYDPNGIQEEFLLPFKNSKSIWVLKEIENTFLMAVLDGDKKAEKLRVFRVQNISTSPVDLQMHPVLNAEKIFFDYKPIDENSYEHRDDSRLKIKVFPDRIRFIYENPDATTLFYPQNFSKKSNAEKQGLVLQFLDFFEYEYSLMLRSFIQSTRSIFNWQPWHWYMKSWIKDSKISSQELFAIFESEKNPDFYRIFYKVMKNGEKVQFLSNGSGYYLMEIILPK